ncbi:Lrp/AsnC family transcriptional regulator [Mycobacterium sp. NPDC003449]
MLSIDRLDVEILRRLTADARTGVVELSSALGVSRNTVQSRVRRLEEAGLVTGYRPQFDLAEAGFPVQALIALETNQVRLSAVVEHLADIAQVLEVHATTGREDLLVRVATVTQAELQELIERIVAIPGVVHSATTLCLTTPLPYRVIPLLEESTRDTGWGRSTPKP